jgi:hypothetical protein
MDHIDAIVFAIEALGFNIGDNDLERRAKASFVVQALTLVGCKIVTSKEIADLIEALRPFTEVPPHSPPERKLLVVDAGNGPWHLKQIAFDNARAAITAGARNPDPPADHGSVIRKNL